MRNVRSEAAVWKREHAAAWGLLLVVSAMLACADCSDAIEDADRFVARPANLTCQSNADCQVVSTGCSTLSRGLCGQVQLNRGAAQSAEWRAINEELNDCDDSQCEQCLALLVGGCADGFCGPRP